MKLNIGQCKWLALVVLLTMLVACGGGNGPSPAEREAARQKQIHLEQQLSALQQQIANLDKEIADMRVEHEQRMNQIIAASQALNNQFNQLKSEVVGAQNTPVTGPANVDVIPPERSAWNNLLRVIIAALLLAAVFILIKYFYGRLHDDDEESDDEGASDEEYRTDLGRVTITPQAQADQEHQAENDPLPPVTDPRRDD
jgi:DNA repair exonuclease SbcCD ATPase subunit